MKCPFDQIGHLLTPETKAENFPKNFILIEMITKRERDETFNIQSMIQEDRASFVSINLDSFLEKMKETLDNGLDCEMIKKEI